MGIQDELLKLLEESKKKLVDARKEEARWNRIMQENLKMVEYLQFILATRFKTPTAPTPEEPILPLGSVPSTRYENMTVSDATFDILRNMGHSLPAGEIWRLLSEGGKNVGRNSIPTILRRDKRFKKVRKGVFALTNNQGDLISEEKELIKK